MSNNTPKYPNPKFFKAKDQMSWADQKKNLKEVGGIIADMFKHTDWNDVKEARIADAEALKERLTQECQDVLAMSWAERKDLVLNGEKHLGKLYRNGQMAMVRREWRGIESTAIDF